MLGQYIHANRKRRDMGSHDEEQNKGGGEPQDRADPSAEENFCNLAHIFRLGVANGELAIHIPGIGSHETEKHNHNQSWNESDRLNRMGERKDAE